MTTATINVKYVNPPKEGKSRWTIKTSDGVLYGLSGTLANQMKAGNSYQVTYKESEFRGQMYKTIESVQQATGSAPSHGGTDDKTAERIFVCGAVNATLSNPQVSPHMVTADAVALVNLWRDVWKATFGGGGAGSVAKNSDMDDEIPF